MRPNTVKTLLDAGKTAVGTWINYPTVVEAETLANMGWDWVCVDVEHSGIDLETVQSLFMAIGANGTIPLARIRWNDVTSIQPVLDVGAYGIIIPMINTVQDAENAVKMAKYPPMGYRSSGNGRYSQWAGSDYGRHANEQVLVIPMIEHIEAVNNIEGILSVPGIAACFIGPNDLAWSMGIQWEGGSQHPRHKEAVAHVIEVAKKLKVPAGYHCGSPEEVNMRIEQGFQFLCCMNDASFLRKSAMEAFNKIKRPA
jgi:4-hydroxy-2-oxoheptanedioate aldolase